MKFTYAFLSTITSLTAVAPFVSAQGFNWGEITVGGQSVKKGHIKNFQTAYDSIQDYYFNGPKKTDVDTEHGWEKDGHNMVNLALVRNRFGSYIVAVFDDQTGTTGGSLKVDVTGTNVPKSKFAFDDDKGEGDRGYPNMSYRWTHSHSDGFAMGPYPTSEQICFSFHSLSGLSGGARFVNGDSTSIQLANNQDELGSSQICLTIPGSPTPSPSGYGDPHFITWSSKTFDFHGGCDLVFLKNPNFHNGLGMNIHIRTSIRTWWSLIQSVVIQIGNNTLEVMGGKKSVLYWIDGMNGQELKDEETTLGDANFVVNFRRINQHQGRARIDLGDGNAISLETFQDFVRVNVNFKAEMADAFNGAVGLMGAFPSGAMLGRDNVTVIEDSDAFGKEWQVLSSEPMLFHAVDGTVQHPQECAMPAQTPMEARAKRRRLGEAMITEEDATLACAGVDESLRDSCIQDVLATNDLDIAGAY